MNKRIEVIGNIASGRSTLVGLLKEAGVNPIYENFEPHPFLESFYSDIDEFSFETEIMFILQHYYDFKTNATEGWDVCDFSIFLDDVFAKVTLCQEDYQIFQSVKNRVIEKIGYPDILIYTKCKVSTSKSRILQRDRKMEQGIELDYLQNIQNNIENLLYEIGGKTKLYIVDTDEISLFSKGDYEKALQEIESFIGSLRN